jgi:hypothetical protein
MCASTLGMIFAMSSTGMADTGSYSQHNISHANRPPLVPSQKQLCLQQRLLLGYRRSSNVVFNKDCSNDADGKDNRTIVCL